MLSERIRNTTATDKKYETIQNIRFKLTLTFKSNFEIKNKALTDLELEIEELRKESDHLDLMDKRSTT